MRKGKKEHFPLANTCFDCGKKFDDKDDIFCLLIPNSMPIMCFTNFYCNDCIAKHWNKCGCRECTENQKVIKEMDDKNGSSNSK